MALPAWVNNGTQGTTASATSLAPAALPGARVNNNILVSWIGIKTTGQSPTITEAGWSAPVIDNAGNESGAWSWRVIDGAEAGPTWNWASAAAATTQIAQFTTPNPGAPIGVTNSADANASTTLTVGSLTTTADNSAILDIYVASTSQTLPTPSGYTQRAVGASANTSYVMNVASANKAGAIDAVSVTITSANWVSFGIELLGSGAGADNTRSTQVVQSTLESYSDATVLRSTQVVQSTLESYSDPTEMRTSQIVMAVLRSAAGIGSTVTPIAWLTNCDTDVTYPGGPTFSSRTVRVDQQGSRPLAHWKRGLDVDRWTLALMPRSEDPISHAPYPDKLNGTPWIEAARSGALEGCEVEIFRAYFPKWPDYQPVITPTGIISVFSGRVAETDVTDTTIILTINDFRELLTTMVPTDVYSSQCRHTLFDFGCTLLQDIYVNTSAVADGSTASSIIAQTDLTTRLSLLGNGSLTYALGTVIMMSGKNQTFQRSVATWSPPSTVTLTNPFPYAPTTGDVFQIYPGCNKTQTACDGFRNRQNYGGFPYIPTIAAALG